MHFSFIQTPNTHTVALKTVVTPKSRSRLTYMQAKHSYSKFLKKIKPKKYGFCPFTNGNFVIQRFKSNYW